MAKTKASKRLKRVIVTASIQIGERKDGTPITAQQFFPFLEGASVMRTADAETIPLDDAESVIRERFARAHGVRPETITITNAPEGRVKHAPTNGSARTGSADQFNADHAIEYARWLARREGVDVAEMTGKGLWRWSLGSKRRKRFHAVEFGHAVSVPSRFRYRGTETGWQPFVTILIPNWDWEPAAPVEEILPDDSAAPVAPSPVVAFRPLPRFMISTSARAIAASLPVAPSCVLRLVAA